MKKQLALGFAALGILHAADHWNEVLIADQPSGYQHTTTEVLRDGDIRTTEETVIVINRLGSKVEVKTKAESLENAAGELLSVREETSQSQQSVVTEAELKGDKILLRSTAGGNSYDRWITLKAAVCGPEVFARLTRERLKKPGDSVSCRLYTPSLGTPYKLTRTVISVEGGLRAKTTIDGVPGNIVERFGSDGFAVETVREMPFGTMVARLTDRETAVRAAAGGELPAESFDRTMARSNVRFADARAVERIKVKITHKKPEMGWPAFASPMQTVLEKTPSAVVLEVRRPEREASKGEEIDPAPFLRPNQILQSDDPEVSRLAREIAGEEQDRFQAARKLQDWVAKNMTFDLGVALTPASEVVKNRHGTCAAYSVLLASMARALGIPSRIAGGFIYAYGIWGGHAWVEVLVDNQWLPVDAAAYRPGLADAARIQFGSYTAADNLAAFSVAGLQMYGDVDIAVLEYSIRGKTIRIPESAPRYEFSDREYRNAGLGFALAKPEGFKFSKLDAVYPDPTIAELEMGASKLTVSLLEAVSNPALAIRQGIDAVSPGARGTSMALDGRAGVLVSSPVKAKLLVPDGQSLWVIMAEGSDARGLLNLAAGGWKWILPE